MGRFLGLLDKPVQHYNPPTGQRAIHHARNSFGTHQPQFKQPVAHCLGMRLSQVGTNNTHPISQPDVTCLQRRGQTQNHILNRHAVVMDRITNDLYHNKYVTKVNVVIGPSGSGKSTLTKLLQGFYQPAGGTIKIDGNDIRYLSANELRHYFGVVPQETILFSGTLYDNLLMANPHATFDQVVHACKMAEIHSSIEALPQGYQTEIGERGVGLSGGQKQRIAIARALIKQPKILIFDEATSSLDATTAEHFAATINQLKGKVTMMFITHAMPKNLLVDEIVRIGQGSLSAVVTQETKQEETLRREAEGGAHG
jgi:ABC-type multidrug transport system fused ATPase/permease subunit